MRRALLAGGLVVSCSWLAACQEKKAPTEPAHVSSATPAARPPAATAPEPTPSAAEQLPPTEADFEEDAAQQITSKNLEQELDKLEQELKSQ